eukprot:16434408-Heterocapsa_arctica.AAC.1
MKMNNTLEYQVGKELKLEPSNFSLRHKPLIRHKPTLQKRTRKAEREDKGKATQTNAKKSRTDT